MSRDMGYYWLRLVIYIFLCVCIGTIYFRVGNEFSSIMVRSYCTWFLFSVPRHIAKELVLRITRRGEFVWAGKGRLHVIRCWILDIYVHWRLPFLRRGYEGRHSLFLLFQPKSPHPHDHVLNGNARIQFLTNLSIHISLILHSSWFNHIKLQYSVHTSQPNIGLQL